MTRANVALRSASTRSRLLVLLALAIVVAGVAAAAALSASRSATSPAASTQLQPTLVKYLPTGAPLVLPQPIAARGFHKFGTGLAADAAGNVYVGVDTFSSIEAVVVFDAEGRYVRDWPTTVGHFAPKLAVGPDGLVYVANDMTGRVSVHRPDGQLVRQLGGGLPHARIMDVEVDAAGNVYLSRQNAPEGDEIVRYDAAGTLTGRFVPFPRTTFGSPSGLHLRGLAVAPDGSIFVTTTRNAPKGRRYLIRLDASGKELKTLDIEFVVGPGRYEDVELANGRLYLAGKISHNYRISDHRIDALVVLSPEGEIVDQVIGRGEAVAVAGEAVYVPGLQTRTRARTLATADFSIGKLEGVHVYSAKRGESFPQANFCKNGAVALSRPPTAVFLGAPQCHGANLEWMNFGDPCPSGAIATPLQGYLGGQPVGEIRQSPEIGATLIHIPTNQVTSGQFVLEWSCVNRQTNELTPAYEWKGRINVIDPSGNILDRKTGRPVEAATVRLEFSLRQTGPFGTPGLSGFVPQVNPQVTGRSGFFGWDVAEGFWRLRVTAFGYRPFTSPVYKVPPEYKGLKLRLLQNPAQQRLLIDPYAGRVGAVRVGSRAGKRVGGLRLRVVAGKIRGISVRARKFRTVHGVKLGSRDTDLFAALPATMRAYLSRKPKAVMTYRAAKATFTVKRNRVVAITVGR